MALQLDKWLEYNKYFTRTKETHSPSHLLLNSYKGGKLYIPRSKEYEFLCQYAEEMTKGSKLYYVEQRPNTFKFMIDIDISDNHYWLNEETQKLVAYIQKTVYDFFETNQIVVCCSSPIKIKSDEIHTGIHLIWPNLFITSDTALCIRRGVIQRLKEEAKEFQLAKSWEDIIDESIYTKNGYRMVGSDKLSSKKGPDNNRLPENRPLSLLFVMDSDGKLNENYHDRLTKNPKALILETSIRYVIDTYLDQGMYINKLPSWLDEDPLQTKAGIRTNSGTVISGKNHLVIENFIRSNLPKIYRGCVKAITKYPKESGYPDALLIKTNSRYCINIGRNHNSCGVYFYATPEGITQRCLCSCNKLDGRKTGLCMDFVSGLYPFDDNTRTILFPELSKNLFETEQIKKKITKIKQKLKKDTQYVPETKANNIKQQKSACDKLFGQITGEYLNL